MTDQTIPAAAIRAWRDKYRGCTGNNALEALDALLPAPPPPTLADMTDEERGKHVGGQVDVSAEAFDGRAILTGFETVTLMGMEFPRALILTRDCRTISAPTDEVTPRPDLPRLTWPGDTPALPEGWRLADHPEHGRVIVTNPTPNIDGYVYFVLPADGPLGHDWMLCRPDELTYLDQEDCPPRDQLTLGGKWADITKLEEALRQKGEAADQAIVLDNDGDAYVWQAVGSGGWMIRIPAQQYGPFRLILNEQGATDAVD